MVLKNSNFSIRVLFYKENKKYVAHALEMDLEGYGQSHKQAEKKLIDLIKIQISFAIFKNDPSLIYFPAEPGYFITYEQIKEKKLKSFIKGYEQDTDYSILDIPLNMLDIPKTNSYAQST